MNRNTFLKNGMLGLAGLGSLPIVSASPFQDSPDPIKIEIVKDFVSAGHGRFERVKELVEEFPNLIYARYDWGKGDFEEGIEAAGHVGNKEIANFLISKGARPNLFVLTMLGQTDLVKPILEAYPVLLQAKGAHGFTLLHHAKVGGEEAKELYAYLEEKGVKEMNIPLK